MLLLPPAPATSLVSPPAPPPPPTASSSVDVGLVSNTKEPPPPHPPVGSGPPDPPGAPPPPKSPPGNGDVPWRIERFSPENTGTVATIWPPAPPRPPAADDPPEPPAMVTVIVETPAGTFHCWAVPAVPKLTVHVVASHDGVGSADARAGWMPPIASTLRAAVTTITATAPRLARWKRRTRCTGSLPRTAANLASLKWRTRYGGLRGKRWMPASSGLVPQTPWLRLNSDSTRVPPVPPRL